MAIIIDGKKVSAQVKEQVRIETEELVKKALNPVLQLSLSVMIRHQEFM